VAHDLRTRRHRDLGQRAAGEGVAGPGSREGHAARKRGQHLAKKNDRSVRKTKDDSIFAATLPCLSSFFFFHGKSRRSDRAGKGALVRCLGEPTVWCQSPSCASSGKVMLLRGVV